MTPTHDGEAPPASTSPLLLALAVAAGTTAYADPVRYDNDGSFQWTDGSHLDITRRVGAQTGTPTSTGSFIYYRVPSTCCEPHMNVRVRGSTTAGEIEGVPVVSVRDIGAVVPSDFASPYGQLFSPLNTLGYYYASGAGFRTEFDSPRFSGTFGDTGYIAVRFHINQHVTHYGWLALRMGLRTSGPVWSFELLAWGYETEPNTPIEAGAVPGPSGALALLAFGAAAGATRARRELNTRIESKPHA